jgi:20S proteasome subunit beta 7
MFYELPQKKHTTTAEYVGSTVIGVKYTGGILLATDTRLNYGGLAKYQNITDRLTRVNNNTIMGSSGEYSDYQELTRVLNEEVLKDSLNSRSYLGPSEITNYLSSICYYRRSKMDPYMTSTVVGGLDWNGTPVLYSVDQFGTKLESNYFATGMGNYFSQSIIEPELPKNGEVFTRRQAIDLLEKCFKVIYYRDCRAGNNIKYAYLERDSSNNLVYEEQERYFKGNWSHEHFRNSTNDRYLK